MPPRLEPKKKEQRASAPPAPAGDEANNKADDGSDCVYRAVCEGQSADEVQRVLEEYASAGARTRRSYEERRVAALNYKHSSEDGSSSSSSSKDETPLKAAHRLGRGDLVGLLLAAGADVRTLSETCSALAVAIHYGQIEALRALLRRARGGGSRNGRGGRGSATATTTATATATTPEQEGCNQPLKYNSTCGPLGIPVADQTPYFCRPVHLALAPPRPDSCSSSWRLQSPPQLQALEVLVREFGADVNGRDALGETPLHWICSVPQAYRLQALDALLSLGADLGARNAEGTSPLHVASFQAALDLVRALLARGASADVFDREGASPLILAIRRRHRNTPLLVSTLMRASSLETRRAVDRQGLSAVDHLLLSGRFSERWGREAVAKLMSSGATATPDRALQLLPVATHLGRQLVARAAASRGAPPPWQVHEAMVGLALDIRELREVEEAVRGREMRVEELEGELRRRGGEAAGGGGSG